MGRGAARTPPSSRFIFGPIEKRRFSGRDDDGAELILLLKGVKFSGPGAFVHRLDVGDAFSSVVVGAIVEMSRRGWTAQWLKSWLREQADQGDTEIARQLQMADEKYDRWDCSLDPDSARAWCERKSIKLDQ